VRLARRLDVDGVPMRAVLAGGRGRIRGIRYTSPANASYRLDVKEEDMRRIVFKAVSAGTLLGTGWFMPRTVLAHYDCDWLADHCYWDYGQTCAPYFISESGGVWTMECRGDPSYGCGWTEQCTF
jgi:hypothetical protein